LWHSGLAKDIEDLWEPWMKEVDQLLEDAALVESVYDAQGKRPSGVVARRPFFRVPAALLCFI
jgi:hypothetical protein